MRILHSFGLFFKEQWLLHIKPTKKGPTTKIRKRSHPPPDLLSFEDESEPTLRDVIKALGLLTACVTVTEKQLYLLKVYT